MRNRIITSVIIATLCAAAVWAQDAELDKDPFHPSEQRPSVPAPAPADNEWGRDPFSSPLSRKAPVQQAPGQRGEKGNLTGIIYSKQARVAIIGGEVLREGSVVGEKRLVDIRRKSVVFMDSAGHYEELFLEDFSLGR